MAKAGKLLEIEKKEGRPMRSILVDLYLRHGNQNDVARALGVPQPTVSLWLKRLGLEQKVILVPSEPTNNPKAS